MALTDFERHVFDRITEVEEGLRELREVTWPVCQGLIDEKSGPFKNIPEKKRFFKFLDVDEVKLLVKLKALFLGMSPSVAVEELRQVRVEEPPGL